MNGSRLLNNKREKGEGEVERERETQTICTFYFSIFRAPIITFGLDNQAKRRFRARETDGENVLRWKVVNAKDPTCFHFIFSNMTLG